MSESIGRIDAALSHIPADDRDVWVTMGMAIKAELGPSGFDIWDTWSQQAATYNAKDAADVWRSIRAVGRVGIATLFHHAKANGWRDNGHYQAPTHEELAERRRRAAERAAMEEEKIAHERAETASKAGAIWKAADEASPDHPYLARKHIEPVATLREIGAEQAALLLGYGPKSGGAALCGRLLVVPVKQGGQLSTLELIDEAGKKAALSGRGSKSGGYWAAQRLPDGDGYKGEMAIGEGVATALSVTRATSLPVVCALSSGNLVAVAKAMRERYPVASLLVLADLVKDTGEPDHHAVDAARVVCARLAIPDFGPDRIQDMTDFNDLAVLDGADAVRRCIECAAVPAAEANQDEESASTRNNQGGEEAGGKFRYGSGYFDVSDSGVRFCGTDKDGNDLPPKWLCSRLDVIGKTRDHANSQWGRLLAWRDDDGNRRTLAMPAKAMQGDGYDMRSELADLGVTINPSRSARDLLNAYILVANSEERARCVDRQGWHGGVYVTAKEAVGQTGEIIVFQNAQAAESALSCAGSAEGWRRNVSALVQGNSRLVFAVSSAFAGPLAELAGEDSGGFHFRGKSSCGKSTALKVAASVWGHPGRYARLWKSTTNGLEGLAALHNDSLLILDELSQIDPNEAGEAAYLLANGQGKVRASRSGGARQAARWRLLFLSAGEESLSGLMSKAGKKSNAGQEIRLADIEADAGAGMGAFDVIHDSPTPAAFAQTIKEAVAQHHGNTGLAFLRAIVQDREQLPALIAEGVREFVAQYVPADASGQVMRVAQRFGLVSCAGQLARHYGLVEWSESDADQAARRCFESWMEGFGCTGDKEERGILSQVRAFFESHGASRFEYMTSSNEQRIINRAGFVRVCMSGEREYLVLPEAFRREVCQSYDPKTVTAALLKAGWIEPGKNGKTSQVVKMPGMGAARCYVFTSRMWGESC